MSESSERVTVDRRSVVDGAELRGHVAENGGSSHCSADLVRCNVLTPRWQTPPASTPSPPAPIATRLQWRDDVVRAALDGLAGGSNEVPVDDWSRTVEAGLAQDPATFYAQVAAASA